MSQIPPDLHPTCARHEAHLATASVALGIAGLLPVLPVLGSLAALVVGAAAPRRADGARDGRAVAGMILGALGLLAPVVALVVYCVVLGYPFPISRYQPS